MIAATTITTSALVVTMLLSYVIPAITALLTKLEANVWLKQAITGLLAAISGLLTTATTVDGSAVFSSDALVLALGSFVLSQAVYLGLYKPHHLSENLLPEVGLG